MTFSGVMTFISC